MLMPLKIPLLSGNVSVLIIYFFQLENGTYAHIYSFSKFLAFGGKSKSEIE